MPIYLLSGRTPEGRRLTERVEASSPEEAIKILEQRNFTDIVLHSDNVTALIKRDMRALYKSAGADDRFISPRESLRIRDDGTYLGRACFMIGKVYRHYWFVFTALFAIAAVRVLTHRWDKADYWLMAMICLPLVWCPVSLLLPSLSTRFHRMIDARAWGRWNEVLALLPPLQGKIPVHSWAFHKAQALAGLGKLEEALQSVQVYADDKQMPLWLWWGQLSGVYSIAQKLDESLAAMEKAASLGPREAVILIDYAKALVRVKHDSKRAKQVLDEARKHAITDVIAYGVDQCAGMIALEDGHALEARDHLQQAMTKLLRLRKASPLLDLARDVLHAYLALANAGAGDFKSAQQHYRRAEPRLRALKYDDLIERCETALNPGSTV